MKRRILIVSALCLAALVPTVANAAPVMRGTATVRADPGQTTASTKILKVQNAAGSDVATVDIEGDLVCRDITASGTFSWSQSNLTSDLTVNTDKFAVTATNGNVNVGPNKFTVAGATGNTVIAGTATSTGDLKVGAAAGTFNVTAASGNTVANGTVTSTGNFKVGASAGTFNVTAASGNTVIGGSLQTGSALTGGTLATVKGIFTWTSGSTNISSIASKGVGTQTFTLAGLASGDFVWLSAAGGDYDFTNLTQNCKVTAADTITCVIVNNSGGAIDPSAQTFTFFVVDVT